MKTAIFDYDGTLSTGYTRYDLGYLMEEKKIIKPGLTVEIKKLQKDYEDGKIDYNFKFAEDKKVFTRYYKGLKYSNLVGFFKDNFQIEKNIKPWAIPLIQRLKADSYKIYVISGSWDFIMLRAQEILEFDDFAATIFTVKEDILTGGYDLIVDDTEKRNYANDYLSRATYSLGFGDSIADFEFLKRVNNAYICNPKKDVIEANLEYGFTVVNDEDVLKKVRM